MNIASLQIERDYDDEWFIEVEHPITGIRIGYAAERFLAEAVVNHALDRSDVKFMTVSLRENDNVLVYRATFPEGATIEHVVATMQGIVDDAERYIRQLRAFIEVAKLNMNKEERNGQ